MRRSRHGSRYTARHRDRQFSRSAVARAKTAPSASAAPALPLLALLAFVALASVLSQPLRASDDVERTYSAIRFLDGEATIQNAGDGERIEAEVNYPVLSGDRLWVPPGSRIHLSLADGSLLAVGGGSELVFDQIALSLDSEDVATRVRLLQGRIDWLLDESFLADELPIIDTANARLFVQSLDCRVAVGANHVDWTEVTTRRGLVEVLTPNGSSLVREDEELTISGIHDTSVSLAAAAPLQELELWASDSADRLARASYDDLESPLAETADLVGHGDWVEVEGDRAWRPRVTSSWRPYSSGRWIHTPTGLYWASYDPWSPVTYHYGGWDLHPRWGWVWYPGYRYAPAHVAWYFGPDYYGWIPTTYYRRHYGFHLSGFGFRFGVWGRAGGYWDPFYDWTFCPSGYFGARRGYRHYRSGHHYRDRGHLADGYVTTDTTYITKERLRRPDRIYGDLHDERRRDRELVDVTPLLSRGKDVPESVRKAVLVRGQSEAAPKVRRGVIAENGTPRSKESGVRRATIRSGSVTAAKPVASPRGTSSVGKGSREPARVIVDGVRQRGNDKPMSADPGWRSTERTSKPSRPDRPSVRPATSSKSSPRGTVGRPAVERVRKPTEVTRPSSSAKPPTVTRGTTTRRSEPAKPVSRPQTKPPSRSSSTRQATPPSRAVPRTTSKPSARSSSPPAVRSPARTSAPKASARPPARSSSTRSSTSSRSTRPVTRAQPTRKASPPPRSSRSSVSSSSSARRSSVSRSKAPSRSPSTRSAPSRSSVSRSKPPSRSSSTRSAPSRSSVSRSKPPSRSSSARSAPSRSSVSRSKAAPSRSSARSSAPSRPSVRSAPSRSSQSSSKSSSSGSSKARKPPAD